MEYNPNKFCDKVCEGVPLFKGLPEEEFRAAMKYEPRPGDLFIVSYPRSGTTWMQYIVLLILRRGKLSDDPIDYITGCPRLEMTGSQAADYIAKAGVARSHLPYHAMPMSKDAKYIYVCRNVKDCAVSNFNVAKDIPWIDLGTFDEFFEYFIRGDLGYGDYFDHIVGWYEHKDDPNVYFITYESLKRNPREEIRKLAKFIGEEHERALLSRPEIMDDILHYSSFDYMKKHINDVMSEIKKGNIDFEALPPGFRKIHQSSKKDKSPTEPKSDFVRKGIVGDWKNYFKPDQLRRLEERIAQKTVYSDVMNLWK